MNKYEAVIMFYPDVEEEKREASFTARISDPIMRIMVIKVEK